MMPLWLLESDNRVMWMWLLPITTSAFTTIIVMQYEQLKFCHMLASFFCFVEAFLPMQLLFWHEPFVNFCPLVTRFLLFFSIFLWIKLSFELEKKILQLSHKSLEKAIFTCLLKNAGEKYVL